jgi:DNA-binding LacI/PurR family transcriptional regulator
MPPLANLVKENRLRIPEDLSIVHFDQNPECLRWFENVEPTAVTIPLRAMGMKLAHMAREISDKPDQVPSSVAVPCGLQEGNSVRRI